MDKLKFILKISILFLIFIPQISYAKSTNEKKFLNSINQIEKLWEKSGKNKGLNEKIYKEYYILYKNYDILNLNISEKLRGNFFYYLCDGTIRFEVSRKNVLFFCKEADKIYSNIGAYKKSNSMKTISYSLANILAQEYAWKYYFSKNKKYLRNAKKYISRNLELEDQKNWTYYYSALKSLSVLNRADLNYQDSIKTHRQIIKFLKCEKKPIDEILCHEELTNFAVLLMDTGTDKNNEKAYEVLKKVLNDENEKNFHADNKRAVRVGIYAYHMSKFNFEEAEKYIMDSIQYINTLDIRGKEQYYTVLDRLYSLQILLGYPYEAAASLEKAFKQSEEELSESYMVHATLLTSLLNIYKDHIPSHNDATRIKNKLEKILESTGDFLDKSFHYASLGEYYLITKNYKKAEYYLDKSFKISNSVSSTPSLIIAKIKVKKHNEARKIINLYKPSNTYDRANLLTAQFILNYDTRNIIELSKNFTDSYLFFSNYSKGIIKEKGNPDIDFFNKKIFGQIELLTNLSSDNIIKISNYFEKKTKRNFNSAIVELFELSRASKFNNRVQNVIERSKDKKIEKEKRILQNLMIEYESIPRLAVTKEEREQNIQKLLNLKNQISNQTELIKIKLKVPYLSKFSNDISLEQVQKKIKRNQGLLSYFFTENIYIDGSLVDNLHIMYLDNNNFLMKKIEIRNNEIENNIKKLISSIVLNNEGDLGNFDFESSKKIYDLILKPFENEISDKNELFIIPHKSLNSLPFEILLKNKVENFSSKNYSNINWFGKKFALSYYPSIYTYFNLNKIEFNSQGEYFLGLGNPSFKNNINLSSKKIDYSKLMSRGLANPEEIKKMTELPETKIELKNIANNFQDKSKLYLGKDFNEKIIKQIDFKKYKYIVFATHAIVADMVTNIAEPGLILTPPIKPSLEDDGVLTVSEIEKFNLNADIVILSACNTASKDGSPNAEGLSGLASAFFHAGTRSMLVTHWDVETNSAVTLTTGSMQNLDKYESLSRALQKTKISMMSNKETSHPFFWAPFVLIGDVRNNL